MRRWSVPRGTSAGRRWTRRDFLAASAVVVGGAAAGALAASRAGGVAGADVAAASPVDEGAALLAAVRAAELPCAPSPSFVGEDDGAR